MAWPAAGRPARAPAVLPAARGCPARVAGLLSASAFCFLAGCLAEYGRLVVAGWLWLAVAVAGWLWRCGWLVFLSLSLACSEPILSNWLAGLGLGAWAYILHKQMVKHQWLMAYHGLAGRRPPRSPGPRQYSQSPARARVAGWLAICYLPLPLPALPSAF